MLRAMRRSTQNWMGKLLVGALFTLLIVSFALWGIEDIFLGSEQERVVAQVGSLDIDADEFSTQYYRQTAEIKRLLGDAFDAEKGREMGYVDQVMTGLTNRALFQNAANQLGLAVTDGLVKQRILADEAFKDDVGQFNEIIFRQSLYESGYTEDSYIEGTRMDLAREQLIDVFDRAPPSPAIIVDPLLESRRERRSANSITIDVDEVEGYDTPSAQQVKAYFDENMEQFQSPELRRISYIRAETEDVVDQIDVAEETLRALYDEGLDAFITPEERNIRQILVPDSEDARKIRDRLDQGDDFDLVAQEEADIEAEDAALGWNRRDDVLDELEEPVFAAEEGAIIGPIESPFGWHVVRVDEIREEKTVTFEEARQGLRDAYVRQEALDVLYELYNQSEDALAGGADLEDVAASLEQNIETTVPVSISGQDITGAPVADLPPDPFLSRAFRLSQGETSEAIEVGDSGFLVIRVDTVEPGRQLSLAEAETMVKARWTRRKNGAKRLRKWLK